MITRLKVENFTAFDSLELEFGEGIQVFVGANGTGKTHLLKFLYCVLEIYSKNAMDDLGWKIGMKMIHVYNSSDVRSLIRNPDEYGESASIVIYTKDFHIYIGIDNNKSKFPVFSNHTSISTEEDTNENPIYIPVKDILGNARGFQSLYRLRNISFEEIYDDILTRAYLPSLKKINPNYESLLEKIEKFIGGKVEIRGEEFYIVLDKKALEMSLIAEGWRKFALLWLLLRNGSLEKNSVLFWDEPEANLNPWATPFLAEILLQLSREGVQIFLATHSYVLLQELDLQKGKHPIHYHSLYFDNGEVRVNTARDYDEIEPNLIEQENIRLYHAELGHILETDE